MVGYLADFGSPGAELLLADVTKFNAVRVRVRRTETQNSVVPMHFARALGIEGVPLEAEATAAEMSARPRRIDLDLEVAAVDGEEVAVLDHPRSPRNARGSRLS